MNCFKKKKEAPDPMRRKFTTVPGDRSWDYPCLKRWKVPFKYKDKDNDIVVKVGLQDGIAVTGYDYMSVGWSWRRWL
jgi:hypothetical protein